MTRQFRIVTAVVAATAVLAAVPATRAVADPVPGTAQSQAGFAQTPTATSPAASVGGALGGLLGPILNPIVDGLVDPLVSAVTTLPQTLLTGVTEGLAGAGLLASTPAPAADPGTNFPDCRSAPWTTPDTCYTLPVNLGLSPLLSLGLGTLSGYTETNTSDGAKPAVAAAQVAHPVLSLLGIGLVDGGVASSRASCPPAGSGDPVATSTISSALSLLGGLVTASIADPKTGALAVTVGAKTIVGLGSLPITNPLGGALPASVTVNQGLLTLKVGLGLSNLLSALGLGSVAGLLNGLGVSTDITLSLVVGPGTMTSGTTGAQAWGLQLGADLAGTVSVNVSGLASIDIVLPSGLTPSGGGNLLNLKLAYSTCGSPGPIPVTGVPPMLI